MDKSQPEPSAATQDIPPAKTRVMQTWFGDEDGQLGLRLER